MKKKYRYQMYIQFLLIITAVVYLMAIPSDIPLVFERVIEVVISLLTLILSWYFIKLHRIYFVLFLIPSIIIYTILASTGNYSWVTFDIFMAISLFLWALFYNQITYGKK